MNQLNILVACEFSGLVRDSFRALGHNAVSCDLLPSERPGPHIQDDVLNHLLSPSWDMLIAFPPCTHLAASGARWFKNKPTEQLEALQFVSKLMRCGIPRICIENPVGIISTHLRKPTQIIHPYQHGHRETKPTCLWLKNLPPLTPSNEVPPGASKIHWKSARKNRAHERSRTYPGIALAMAAQWGNIDGN